MSDLKVLDNRRQRELECLLRQVVGWGRRGEGCNYKAESGDIKPAPSPSPFCATTTHLWAYRVAASVDLPFFSSLPGKEIIILCSFPHPLSSLLLSAFFVKMGSQGGCLKLPPGFRFHPTDEELVVQYLRRRVFSFPLPASVISDIDICQYDPWDLPGDGESDKYFFTRKEAKYPNGNRSNRSGASGYWKATGKDRPVYASSCNQVVGMKKSLVFYRGKAPKGFKTEWIMHEYRLTDAGSQPFLSLHRKNSSLIPMEDWVLCRIFLKRTSQRSHITRVLQYVENPWDMARPRNPVVGRPTYIDFMMENQRNPDASESSSITEVSSPDACDSEEGICSSKPFSL